VKNKLNGLAVAVEELLEPSGTHGKSPWHSPFISFTGFDPPADLVNSLAHLSTDGHSYHSYGQVHHFPSAIMMIHLFFPCPSKSQLFHCSIFIKSSPNHRAQR
jgi:hypothetical protein